ncbi:hypothetical protein ACHAW5_008494 [Stephanodiscus triporus]|uniref:Uncharacterized protein n=1 Tax=Stephanodiscus triporus TaxID=2934178 RepID=A0ABD3MGT8_9STRA
MPPTRKNFQPRPTGRSPLLIVALLILLSSSSSSSSAKALFGRKDKAAVDDGGPPPTGGGGDEKDDAVANAKRLVDELNSAAMGTVTTYSASTNREKEPATCDSIMAKSLVLANEEKAAIAAQLDSVVSAAALLSGQIEDLSSTLEVANGKIATLEKELGDSKAAFEAEVAERVAEMERALADAKAEHAVEIKAVKEDAARALSVERDASKVKMDALRNTTADAIANMEKTAGDRIKRLERNLNDAELRHSTIVEEMRKDANNRMDSCMAKSDMDRESILKHANKQIEEAKEKAKREVDLKTKEIRDNHDKHQAELSDLVAKHAERINEMKASMEKDHKQHREEISDLVKAHADGIKETKESMAREAAEARETLKAALATKDLAISDERAENERLRSEMQKLTIEAQNVQKSLRGDVEMARTSSIKLEKEVSFWKETHEQQGYCNITLMKEDSRRFAMNALDGASRGLDSGHEFLMTQLDTLQKMGADFMPYLDKVLLPAVERIVADARDKVVALYAKHLEGPVANNLLPLYNERIYPVYNRKILPAYMEHVSPVVRRIQEKAAVATQKSQEGAQMARSKAASLVRDTSNVLLEKNKEMTVLPGWLHGPLYRASLDGEWAVEKLLRVFMVFVIILSRSLIFRVIRLMFSLVWFFCPLRLLVKGRSKETGENDAKEGKKKSKGDKSKTKENGKAKVH